jgi:hypothetical protein
MSPINPLTLNPMYLVLDRVRAWPVQSQQGARRNAMIANTTLLARRAEREDVEAFLASRARSTPGRRLPAAAQR